MAHPSEPVSPGNIPADHGDGLIGSMVGDFAEEDSACEEGYLERLDVDVLGITFPAQVESYKDRDDLRKHPVEVEQEE